MRSFAAGIAATVVVIALVGQVALPPYLAGRVEDRLRAGGGNAKVSLSAIPSFALLAGHGSRFEARGSGLVLDTEGRREQPFERLDGFDEVSIDIARSQAGPVRIEELALDRDAEQEPYRLGLEATTNPRELAGDIGSRAGGPLGALAGELAGRALPGGGATELPVRIDAEVESDGGSVRVLEASVSVAGLPSGPLTEIVLAAVLERL